MNPQNSEERQLHQEISRTRADLGDTVEALTHKADVPTRLRRRGTELRRAILARRLGIVGGLAGLVALAVLVRQVKS